MRVCAVVLALGGFLAASDSLVPEQIPMRIYVSVTLTGQQVTVAKNRKHFLHALPACIAAGMHGMDKQHVQIVNSGYWLDDAKPKTPALRSSKSHLHSTVNG
jgi:hypothetical protein